MPYNLLQFPSSIHYFLFSWQKPTQAFHNFQVHLAFHNKYNSHWKLFLSANFCTLNIFALCWLIIDLLVFHLSEWSSQRLIHKTQCIFKCPYFHITVSSVETMDCKNKWTTKMSFFPEVYSYLMMSKLQCAMRHHKSPNGFLLWNEAHFLSVIRSQAWYIWMQFK